MFDSLEIQYPFLLWGLIPLLLLGLYLVRRRTAHVTLPLLPLGTPSASLFPRFLHLLPYIFYILASFALLFALTSPRYILNKIEQKFEGVDIMLGFDLSASMGFYDVPPEVYPTQKAVDKAYRAGALRPRLPICKEAVIRLIKKRPNDRFGLVPFADQSFVVCPPTLDHHFLLEHIEDLKLHTFGEGTGLASPIVSVLDHIQNTESKRQVMILITDGCNTIRNKITPLQAADIAAHKKLTIHTIGLGNTRAFRTDLSGHPEPVDANENYDEPLLREIAQKTGGIFFTAEDEEGLKATLNAIDTLEKSTGRSPPIVVYETLAPNVMGLFVLLLCLGFLCEHTFCLRYP